MLKAFTKDTKQVPKSEWNVGVMLSATQRLVEAKHMKSLAKAVKESVIVLASRPPIKIKTGQAPRSPQERELKEPFLEGGLVQAQFAEN